MVNHASEDEQHLRLLSIFHYVVGALAALFALFPLIHLTVGWFLIHAPPPAAQQHDGPPLAMIGWLFVLFGAVFFLAGESIAACIVAAGWFIRSRTRYWFVFVMACLQCALFP